MDYGNWPGAQSEPCLSKHEAVAPLWLRLPEKHLVNLPPGSRPASLTAQPTFLLYTFRPDQDDLKLDLLLTFKFCALSYFCTIFVCTNPGIWTEEWVDPTLNPS